MGILTFLSAMIISIPVFATLGDAPNPSLSPKTNLYHQRASAPPVSPFYTVTQSAYGGGMVREYANTQGIVFAITWIGMSPLQPQEYFGAHVSSYNNAVARSLATPRNGFRKPKVIIKDDDFVHESFGHMGAIRGRAYVPSLIPTGVQLDEID